MVKKNSKGEKVPTAKEIAESMAANMQTNMEDPNFEIEREHRISESMKKTIKEHRADLEKVGIHVPDEESKNK